MEKQNPAPQADSLKVIKARHTAGKNGPIREHGKTEIASIIWRNMQKCQRDFVPTEYSGECLKPTANTVMLLKAHSHTENQYTPTQKHGGMYPIQHESQHETSRTDKL